MELGYNSNLFQGLATLAMVSCPSGTAKCCYNIELWVQILLGSPIPNDVYDTINSLFETGLVIRCFCSVLECGDKSFYEKSWL